MQVKNYLFYAISVLVKGKFRYLKNLLPTFRKMNTFLTKCNYKLRENLYIYSLDIIEEIRVIIIKRKFENHKPRSTIQPFKLLQRFNQ